MSDVYCFANSMIQERLFYCCIASLLKGSIRLGRIVEARHYKTVSSSSEFTISTKDLTISSNVATAIVLVDGFGFLEPANVSTSWSMANGVEHSYHPRMASSLL